jgi:hypothetical protein
VGLQNAQWYVFIFTLQAHSIQHFQMPCGPGASGISGGVQAINGNADAMHINESGPFDDLSGWNLRVENTDGNSVTVRYWLLCAPVTLPPAVPRQ